MQRAVGQPIARFAFSGLIKGSCAVSHADVMVRFNLGLLVLAAACGGDAYAPNIDPAHFVAGVNNPYFPLVPGTVFTYQTVETGELDTVTVTSDTIVLMGVTCVVVHDVATDNGVVHEDTLDYYAQDDQGTVWYMGEDTTEIDGAMMSTEGSWRAGVDGGQPGMIIEGTPKVGDTYRQEFLSGEAEDEGEVLALDASITVPFGSFTGCMETRDFSALEPDVEEHKLYCPGTGNVEAHTTKGGAETEQLTSVVTP